MLVFINRSWLNVTSGTSITSQLTLFACKWLKCVVFCFHAFSDILIANDRFASGRTWESRLLSNRMRCQKGVKRDPLKFNLDKLFRTYSWTWWLLAHHIWLDQTTAVDLLKEIFWQPVKWQTPKSTCGRLGSWLIICYLRKFAFIFTAGAIECSSENCKNEHTELSIS